MYSGGHILASGALALISSKRLDIQFVKLAPVMIATNLLDTDHLKYFYLDDGTANSLVMHPAHIYAGVLFFLIFFVGLIYKKLQYWSFAVSGAVALHLTGDAISFWLNYNILLLGMIDALLLIFIAISAKRINTGLPFIPLMVFFATAEILSSAVQAYLAFVLKLVPQENIIVFIVSPVIFLLTAITFWLMFKKYRVKVKTILN